MDTENRHPDHAARPIEIDGVRHDIFRERIQVAELFDLAGKSPDEWEVQVELQGGDAVTLSFSDELELHVGKTAVFRMKRRGHHHEEPYELTVVVASDPVQLEVTDSTLLSLVVQDALAKAGSTGRENEDWELKTEAGAVLSLASTLQEAGVERGSTLFLSLKAGAAGEVLTELLVDPSVSATKFEAEVATFRALERKHSRRGIWLIRAEYPSVFLVFGAPNAKGIGMIAFGVAIDFSNYDLWAPSVRIVDPFTEVPYKAAELPPQAQLLRRTGECQPAAGIPTTAVEIARFMMWQDLSEIPFLCHPGVREYHSHPAHTGDDWLLHRGNGEGTLTRIVELLFQYGAAGMIGINVMPALGLPPI